jgi:protein-S-isoprenylcysteine O-methyltransferase Ste14
VLPGSRVVRRRGAACFMKMPQLGRMSALAVLALGAAEVLIMVSPFAGFFYASLRFEPILGLLAASPLTAWLDGFFLNHAVVTTSLLLELHRKAAPVIVALGLAGFVASMVQVYGNKLRKRGVARGVLYRFVRHPQYLCLGLAGWGVLTLWPRFLLLGLWVTMLFLYAGLARHEERRMEQRFGDAYRQFAETRGAFLPRSPIRRLFEASVGRLHPRPLGWVAAYAVCLLIAFSLGFVLRAYTRASTPLVFEPEDQAVVISAWPQPDPWIRAVYRAAAADPGVRGRLQGAAGDQPVVITVLPPRYGMRDMYYGGTPDRPHPPGDWRTLMGVDPDGAHEPVEVVFSRADKAYKPRIALSEALDAAVRLTPLVVADVVPATAEVTRVHIPPPENAWGPNVVMPLF